MHAQYRAKLNIKLFWHSKYPGSLCMSPFRKFGLYSKFSCLSSQHCYRKFSNFKEFDKASFICSVQCCRLWLLAFSFYATVNYCMCCCCFNCNRYAVYNPAANIICGLRFNCAWVYWCLSTRWKKYFSTPMCLHNSCFPFNVYRLEWSLHGLLTDR